VQGVGARFQHYYDRDWNPDEERVSRLVVIGQRGLDQAAIEAALTA
jgi:cobalamin biosynthesis protein CobW